MPVGDARNLLVEFGLDEKAYTGSGQTDGVCFVIRNAASTDTLFERCLDPLNRVEDRGMVGATVVIPEGVKAIVAETRCRASCNWDWSVWTQLQPE
jgi:hypothetical protein